MGGEGAKCHFIIYTIVFIAQLNEKKSGKKSKHPFLVYYSLL